MPETTGLFSKLAVKMDRALGSESPAGRRQKHIDEALMPTGVTLPVPYYEPNLKEIGLGKEAKAFVTSFVPGLAKVLKDRGRLAQTGAELLPLPIAPQWAVGDVMGLIRAFALLENKMPIEGMLGLLVTVIPLFPTGPAQAVIAEYMTRRFVAHTIKNIHTTDQPDEPVITPS